jgi:SAF domain
MSTVIRRSDPPSVNGSKTASAVKARADAVALLKKPNPPSRRRIGRAAIGIAAAMLGCWAFASMYLSAGHRTNALVLARTVPRFEIIKRDDLRTVKISSDTEAAHITASRMNEIIGRTAADDLSAGSLLAEGQLLPAGEQLLKPDDAVVGVLLAGGDTQVGVRKGSKVVLVIRTPQATGTATTAEVTGWVYSAATESTSSRERAVEVVVPRGQAAEVSAAGADKWVTIVMLAE